MKALSIPRKSYYFSLTVLSLPNGVDIQMTEAALAEATVVLTDRAAKRVARILAKEPEGTVLRISVAGGGCSGFQYEYNLVQETPANDDIVLAKNGATVLIDAMSLEFMGGSEIDFSDDLIGQSFQIKNPNAVASCGCGTSFAV
ncbi:MAG: iron-sulfur cluster assembly accessory protein [Devosia sp.]|nr:iron-sulfur cluster assembly accessory protein [Devosia sp.]